MTLVFMSPFSSSRAISCVRVRSGIRARARIRTHSLDIASVSVVARDYDAFLLDQFGVLHDGVNAYDGALKCVEELRAIGPLYVVSNSSRKSSGTMEKLAKMGFARAAFAGAKTSGDCAAAFIHACANKGRVSEGNKKLNDEMMTCFASEAIARGVRERGKARCAHVTWSARGSISLADVERDVEVVDVDDFAVDRSCVEKIDFLLIHGTEAFGREGGKGVNEKSIDDVRAFVEECAAARVPCVVANPDFVTVSGDELITMPGTLGKWYVDAFQLAHGASENEARAYVRLTGKPDAMIYEALLLDIERASGKTLDKSRILAVGDSLEHDIVGASRAGIDTLFIRNGIHARDIERDGAERLIQAHAAEARPKYHTATFTW